MKKLVFSAFIGLIILTGCSSSEAESVKHFSVERNVVKAPSSSEAKTLAKIGVEGMSCGISCVKKIESTLGKLKGVKVAKVDFNEGEKVDFANIEYDESLVSEQEMVAAIEQLSNGQYKVNSVQITVSTVEYEKLQEPNTDPEKTVKPSAYNYSLGLKLPNIFDLIESIVN